MGVTASRGTVEILHKWIEGERGPLDALLDEFGRQRSAIDVVDEYLESVPMEVKLRLLNENPPSGWVEFPGEAMQPYHEAEVIGDLTDAWDRAGMESGYLDGVADLASIDGSYYGVPLNIHRINGLFYNIRAAERAGIDPARLDSPDELVRAIEGLDEDDPIGLEVPMKNPWTVRQLWVTLFLGQAGAPAYETVAGGAPEPHRREIRESIDVLSRFLDLTSEDSFMIDMMAGSQRLVDGEAICFQQGDWMGGIYGGNDTFDYGTDWEYTPFPGNEDIYGVGSDAILATEAAYDESFEEFLTFVGQPETLEMYNRVKGSIPPRTDVSVDEYPQFLQDQFRDFERSRYQPGSSSIAFSPGRVISVLAAITEFMQHRDREQATDDLVAAFDDEVGP
jgi:glucose/mannose transport system substrate-binding protein